MFGVGLFFLVDRFDIGNKYMVYCGVVIVFIFEFEVSLG